MVNSGSPAFVDDGEKRSILLKPQLGDESFGLFDLLHREFLVGFAAEIKQLLIEICRRRGVGRLLQSLLERVVEGLDDLRLNAPWTGYAEGRVRDHVDAEIAQGWHARPVLGPGGAPGNQQSELTGVDELRPSARIRNRMDVTTQQRVHHLGVALERNVGPVDALPFGDLLHRDVQTGAGAWVP